MDWHTYINNIHWGGCCLTTSLDLKGKDYQITGNPRLKNFGYCTATFMYNARFLSPNVLFLIFWNDCYGGFLAMKSSATTPFYCLKFAPFCGRHSFLCIVAVCWWKNEAYTDWYYSILLLSVIINSVTFVTDDFIFVKMERITKFTEQERIPVKITISIREKQWCAGVLGPFLPYNNSCLFLLL